MILVDTSVWTDHFRAGEPLLVRSLEAGRITIHPFVTGEIALGNLRQPGPILAMLGDLPQLRAATDPEVLHFISQNQLFGLGIGYVDVHLLAATRLTPGTSLWTRDKRLNDAAYRLGLSAKVGEKN